MVEGNLWQDYCLVVPTTMRPKEIKEGRGYQYLEGGTPGESAALRTTVRGDKPEVTLQEGSRGIIPWPQAPLLNLFWGSHLRTQQKSGGPRAFGWSMYP